MQKLTILSVLLLTSAIILGQDKVYEYKIEEGKTLTNFTNSKNGFHYIKTGKQVAMAKFKDDVLVCLDKDLNEVYSVNVNSNDFIGNPYFGDMTSVSNNGFYYHNIDQIISINGEVKEYSGTVKQPAKGVKKMSKLTPMFKFFNDYGYTIIGPDIGRKNYKKVYLDGDVKIFNLRHSDLVGERNVLEIPNFETEKEEPLSWFIGGEYKDKFCMWSTELNEELNKVWTYFIVMYNYDGSINSKTKISLSPYGKRYIPAATKTYGFSNYLEPEGFNNAFNKNFYNESENNFVLTGFYADQSKKKGKTEDLLGVYICKYDIDGKKLWENKFSFSESKKDGKYPYSTLYFETKKNGHLRFSTEEGLFNLFTIDKGTGEMKKEFNNVLENFKENKANHERKEIKEFISVYSNKQYKKKFFSFKSIHAMLIHPEIEKYITSVSAENNIYFDATFLEEGGFILKEFNKEDRLIKLLKFN